MFEKLRTYFNEFAERVTSTELKGKTFERTVEELKLNLVENDVALNVANLIGDRLREKTANLQVPRFTETKGRVKAVLYEILEDLMKGGGPNLLFHVLEEKKKLHEPAGVMFVGINGTGKTTTIAKLAHLLIKRDFSVLLACADTYRTGSMEQLATHGNRLGVETLKHGYGADAAAVAFDALAHAKARGINVVLIDTAGRMQTNKNLMDEVKKIERINKPDITILVLDALTGNDAVEQSRIFNEVVRIHGIILAKLDADAKGGNAISIASTTGKPIFFLGIGQSYEDLIPFNANLVLEKIFS